MITERISFGLLTLVITISLLVPGRAYAHVTNDMPDSVAEVEYKILLEFKPEDIDTRTKLAHVLIRLGKLDQAEAELAKAAKKSADDSRVMEGFIVLRLQQKRLPEALDLAKKAIRISPDQAILYLQYGNVLAAQGEKIKALKLYRTGLEKTGNDKNNHDRTQLEKAINRLTTVQ